MHYVDETHQRKKKNNHYRDKMRPGEMTQNAVDINMIIEKTSCYRKIFKYIHNYVFLKKRKEQTEGKKTHSNITEGNVAEIKT